MLNHCPVRMGICLWCAASREHKQNILWNAPGICLIQFLICSRGFRALYSCELQSQNSFPRCRVLKGWSLFCVSKTVNELKGFCAEWCFSCRVFQSPEKYHDLGYKASFTRKINIFSQDRDHDVLYVLMSSYNKGQCRVKKYLCCFLLFCNSWCMISKVRGGNVCPLRSKVVDFLPNLVR